MGSSLSRSSADLGYVQASPTPIFSDTKAGSDLYFWLWSGEVLKKTERIVSAAEYLRDEVLANRRFITLWILDEDSEDIIAYHLPEAVQIDVFRPLIGIIYDSTSY